MDKKTANDILYFLANQEKFFILLYQELDSIWPNKNSQAAADSIGPDTISTGEESAYELRDKLRVAIYGAMTKMYGPPEQPLMIGVVKEGTEYIWELSKLWPDVPIWDVGNTAGDVLSIYREMKDVIGETTVTIPSKDKQFQQMVKDYMTSKFGPQRVKEDDEQ